MTDWMLSGDRKRVCVTLGTGLPHDPSSWSLLEELVTTLDELEVETVMAVPDPDELQSPQWQKMPGSVRGAGRVPLSALLPTCDLAINHGGAGSTMTALVSGVPQLALPHYGDQFRNAAQVTQRGVGLGLPRPQITPGAVRDAVSSLLSEPGFRAAAEAIAAENARQQSPAALVKYLQTSLDW
jgi:UDP:flavonoid glycosyltransferase YjiC (YdhE family)